MSKLGVILPTLMESINLQGGNRLSLGLGAAREDTVACTSKNRTGITINVKCCPY